PGSTTASCAAVWRSRRASCTRSARRSTAAPSLCRAVDARQLEVPLAEVAEPHTKEVRCLLPGALHLVKGRPLFELGPPAAVVGVVPGVVEVQVEVNVLHQLEHLGAGVEAEPGAAVRRRAVDRGPDQPTIERPEIRRFL